MPLPKPRKKEKRKDFLKRCMSSKTMKREFKKNEQRVAVCYKQWKNK